MGRSVPLGPMLRRASAMRPLARLAMTSSILSRGMAIKVGDAFPTGVNVQIAFKENHPIEELTGKGNILMVSLPGAFTPT